MVAARSLRLICACAISVAAIIVWRSPPPISAADNPVIERHRNLGKAFFENPTTHLEAIAEFKKALDLAPNSMREKLNYALALIHGNRVPEGIALLEQVQRLDPSLPHTWFNLGLYYKKSDQQEKALAQFQQFAKLVPNEPIAHYQLGTLHRSAGRNQEAVQEFEKASTLNPDLAAAHFQLYNIYRQSGRPEDAAKQLAIFKDLKAKTEGAAIPEDVDWCNYAEIYDPPHPTSKVAPAKPIFDDHVLAAATGMFTIDAANIGHTDILAWSPEAVHLYRNGVQEVPNTGLEQITGATFIAAGDFDNDGFNDLCILTESGPVLYRNNHGHFEKFDANLPQRKFVRAVWIDYDHDYDLDLILLGDQPALMRNQGKSGFDDRTADFPFVKGHPLGAGKLRSDPDSKAFDLAVSYSDHEAVLYRDQLGGRYAALEGAVSRADIPIVEGDFRNAGRLDQAIIENGKLHIHFNRTVPYPRWISIRLTGVKNLKLAEDARVEVKAGSGYWYTTYSGVPLLFPVGIEQKVDVVRITWPNGLIQNETNQLTNKTYNYEEAQRLSGSCPMIWTQNGAGFQFITDVLGVAPLGASDGEGSYFPVDHDEYVTIPSKSLQLVNNRYEIRITEELSEVSYLDQIQLLTLDHPSSKEVFTNEKFKGPPYPEFRLYEVPRCIYPTSAHDDAGNDVRDRLLKRDQKYPDQFPRTELGVAKQHTLELDFPNTPTDAVLLANGWVDWPDGSTFRAASQESKAGLVMPYLQMQDAAGKWITVNEDMGMPAGKPKTIAVPLHFISQSRKLRIVTSLCVYWDEIFLSETAAPAEAHQQQVDLISADLHFRGFSESVIDPQRKQPDTFLYKNVETTSYWNPTPGLYTKYGDVRELASEVDDRLIIMGSGDELRLVFDGSKLPPLSQGWTRDFLLKVDGWAKDRDPNTAFSQSVEPLPFHGMSQYPYPTTEHFPDDAPHRQYRENYNTRPALKLIRPLTWNQKAQRCEKWGQTTLSQGVSPASEGTVNLDAAWTEGSVPIFRPVPSLDVQPSLPSRDHRERSQ
ncbi:MAG TPA: FG-GAP-like repeat-containing protein [Bryobacteraceae bacterium]|jgi:tetratricopeptide (TPR) repeat protein|nr:FG-GAP-like repeat-containing protein [Bryobacteraceae bacterium]